MSTESSVTQQPAGQSTFSLYINAPQTSEMLNIYVGTPQSASKRRRFDETYKSPTVRPAKRLRKASQHPQFSIYRDETSSQDTSDKDASFKLPPSRIDIQTEKIQPHIAVEIPFQAEFHQIRPSTHPENRPIKSSNILQDTAVNRAQRVPRIPEKWLRYQPNDHTSMYIYTDLYINIIFKSYLY